MSVVFNLCLPGKFFLASTSKMNKVQRRTYELWASNLLLLSVVVLLAGSLYNHKFLFDGQGYSVAKTAVSLFLVWLIGTAVGIRKGYQWPKVLLLVCYASFLSFSLYLYSSTAMVMVPRTALFPLFLQCAQWVTQGLALLLVCLSLRQTTSLPQSTSAH
jgi:hypothetical protein